MLQPVVIPLAPKTLRQGDTWLWSRTYPDFPAPAWVLTARIVSAGLSVAAAATASGTDHLVGFAASVTKDIVPGDYTLIETVSNGPDRYTVGQGALAILPDPAGAAFDPRGPMRKAYATALAALAASVSSGTWQVLELRITDRLTRFHTPDELRKQLGFLRQLADAEDARRAGTRRTYAAGTTFGASFGAQS